MIHSVRFIVVLDTNVIYPIIIRDILFWFAYYDLYTPKWSEDIFDEWKNIMIKKGITEEEVNKRINNANNAFPDALVHNYKSIIDIIQLPDKKDCHVLAAAIKTNASLIVTNNIKHFPEKYLQSFGLKAKTADDFLTDIIDLNPKQAIHAFKEMVLNKKNPLQDEWKVLDLLKKASLINTAKCLHTLL
jgi:predicted nucleic acid-binding protein